MPYKLSFLITARNEEFLGRTVRDILDHTSNQTEIIVGIDGEENFEDMLIPEHERVTVVKVAKPIGQRAMVNKLCRLSTAKYVVKADGHCSFDQDWDIKMLKAFEKTGDNVTMVSIMRNLWAFDWECPVDGKKHYQDKGDICPDCGGKMKKTILWIAKERPQSTSYRFDTDMHFQYFNEHKRTEKYKKELETGITETMNFQGSTFMLTREKFWELNICDEEWGSWGGMACEVACKTWLSGGRCLVNHSTWNSHLFRTKEANGFGFPYKQDNKQVEHARQRSKELFLDNTWEKQIYPLSWLVDKFEPVPSWHDGTDNGMLEKVREWGKNMIK